MGESVAVTICVPLYNHAATVERCLRSALEQDHDDFEILVVDDASRDGSAQVARGLVRETDRVLVNDTRLGAAGNHNRCIELARGELIQFLHGDDELLPAAVSTLSQTFDDGQVAMAFAPRQVITDDQDFAARFGTLHHRFRQLAARNEADDLITEFVYKGAWNNWFGEPTSVMFRRDRALTVGGFRSDLAQVFDADLWLHLSAGHRIAFVDRALSIRHHGLDTLSEDNRRERRSWLDHTRVLWGVLSDPQMPRRSRVFAGLWLSTCHPSSVIDAVRSPAGQRLRRLREVACVPWTEMTRRRHIGARGGVWATRY